MMKRAAKLVFENSPGRVPQRRLGPKNGPELVGRLKTSYWERSVCRRGFTPNQACSNSANLLPSESTIGSSSLPSELLTARRFDSSRPPLSTCSSSHNPMIVDEILDVSD